MAVEPFAARVQAGMRARGLTLRGLCREVGLDPSFFSKVLAGKRSPPSEEAVLRRIAGVLGLDAAELVVSAGRIPLEWQGLWRDAALFERMHAMASGRTPSPRTHLPAERRPIAAKPAACERPSFQIPASGRLSEELL